MKNKQQSKSLNLELGKKLFYGCNGSKVCLDRNFRADYINCNIPKDLERKWSEDIVRTLDVQISELDGQNKVKAIINYLQIVNDEKQISKLVEVLKEDQIDSFSRLQLCEMLSEIYAKGNRSLNKELIRKTIEENIVFFRDNEIIIHDSYKECDWLGEDFFSKDALNKRINNIHVKVMS